MSITLLVLGFLLDLIFGDPHWMPHPVRAIGWLIGAMEKALRRVFPKTPQGERLAGAFFAVLVPALSVAVVMGLLAGAHRLSPFLGAGVEILLCYQIFATKALKTESMKVCDRLEADDLPGARKAVSMIVGRDTENLTETQVAKAAVETVAENTSDGVIAPMLFLAIAGVPGGIFYKAVNTMDSMVGYKNDRYLNFGRWAAKLDDLVNWIPSRFAALMMIVGAKAIGLDAAGAWRIFRRDRFCHASPNSAQTESACAGALGVQLAGNAYYFGKLYEKPTIGDPLRPVEPEDISLTCDLMYATAIFSLLFIGAVRLAIHFLQLF